ncbi:hypothetical protein H8D36_05205 [archaeon]|nr:hypothetical protein [archaeon]MBL7056794.1 hypothetical protein [Candidatus Woesearchaeota archaeon]
MTKKKKDDDLSINFSGIGSKLKKFEFPKNQAWIIILLIAIAIFFSIYYRSYSYYLPVTDDWAYNNIYNNVRSQVASNINLQYPNLPTDSKNQMINEEVSKFLQQQGPSLQAQIEGLSKDMKTRFQNDEGQTYLLAIDPYFYYRYSRNIIEKGHYGDSVDENGHFDSHVLGPGGKYVPDTFHSYFGAFFHRFVNIFANNSLMTNFFFIPVFLSALAVIPAFFIARKKVGLFGGFIAGMIVAIHPAFIGRTAGGFADTDPYNVLFPLFIAWLFIEAFESDSWKKQLGLLAGAGFLTGLYSFAWSGWWYIFDFLLLAIIIFLVYLVVKSLVQYKGFKKIWNKDFKNALTMLVLFIVLSGIFVSLFSGASQFQNFIDGPLKFKVIKQAAKPDLWPNVYTTVAELNAASINSIIKQIGGKLFFFIACIGVILTLFKKKNVSKLDFVTLGIAVIVFALLVSKEAIKLSPVKYLAIFAIPVIVGLIILLKDKRNTDVKYALFLTIWFAGTIYASTQGTRFVLLMVPAYAIALGIAFGTVQSWLTNWTAKEFKFNRKIMGAVLIVLLLLLLIGPMKSAHNTAKSEIPSMTDGWWNTLTNIQKNSAENAIITSWWDFGHWFKAVADRAVTFDGGSQNRPQAHWVGKLLMSNNEDESIAILRMLDCGANNAFDEVNLKYDDTETSVDVIYEIIMKNDVEAKAYLLEKGFTEEESVTVIKYTHCSPPEAFLITSEDMVGKAGVWSHFGSWNFDRSFIYNNVRKQEYQESIDILTTRFGFTEEKAADYFYEVQAITSNQEANNWIAPWPNYGTPSIRGCKNESDIVTCNMNIGIGESNQGQSVSIAAGVFNLSDPSNSRFVLAFIDRNSGLVAATQEAKPANVVIFDEEGEHTYILGGDIFLDLVYEKEMNKALITHPSLSKSLFTKLFFFEGRHTSHFEKFSDMNSMTGGRILVWKVLWD